MRISKLSRQPHFANSDKKSIKRIYETKSATYITYEARKASKVTCTKCGARFSSHRAFKAHKNENHAY